MHPHPESGGENWRGELLGTACRPCMCPRLGCTCPSPSPGIPDLPESQGSLVGRGGQAHLSQRIRHPRAHPVRPSARCPLGHPSPPVDGNGGLRALLPLLVRWGGLTPSSGWAG